MQSLIENLDKLHTTDLGIKRIRKNIDLQADNVIMWCKGFIQCADSIVKQGKNFYVYGRNVVVTINATSYTIITAHQINARIREIETADYFILPEFLYFSIFIPEGDKILPRSIIDDPEIFVYIKDFGSQPGDIGVVAEQNKRLIGAAWTRIIPTHSYLDTDAPELVISVLPEFRGYGTGTKLLKKLFEALEDSGYTKTSLCVENGNPAVRLYERLGYYITGQRNDHAGHLDHLMMMKLPH